MRLPPPHPRIALLLFPLLLTSCLPTSHEQLACAAFERFQDALFQGDRAALGATLSRLSLQALPEIPLERAQGKQRLLAIAVRAAEPHYHVDVCDPNEKGSRSTFVVAREEGRYVVDLVATAGLHQVPDPNGKREWRIEPGTVSKRDVDLAAAAIERGAVRQAAAPARR